VSLLGAAVVLPMVDKNKDVKVDERESENFLVL
jgi:hypothetical protein